MIFPPGRRRSRSRVASNAAAGAISQIILIFLSFVTTPIILQNLGITAFGVLAVTTSITGYIGILDLGIGASLARHMTFHSERDDGQRVKILATFGVLFYTGFALVLLPLVYLGSLWVGAFLHLPREFHALLPALLSFAFMLLVASSATGILTAKLAAHHRVDIAAGANICGSVVQATLLFTLVARFPTVFFVMTCVGAQIATSALVMYVANRVISGRMLASVQAISWSSIREVFSFGVWTQLSSVTGVISLEADKAIISREIGVNLVGSYQVANRLALLNRALPLQLLAALLPEVTARISNDQSDGLQGLYRKANRTLMLLTLLITGFTAGASQSILRLWLGTHLVGASALCIALSISYAVNNLTGVGTTVFRAQALPRYETYYGTLSAVLNIGFTLLLIGTYGINGVVAGTVIGNVIGSSVFLVIFHRISGISWWDSTGSWLVKLTAMTAGAGVVAHLAAVLLIRNGVSVIAMTVALVVAGMSYLLVFFMMGVALRFWDLDDRRLITNAVGMVRKVLPSSPRRS